MIDEMPLDDILAATGHRPDKLGGYEHPAKSRLIRYTTNIIKEYHPQKFITGMAMGWDQACAWACVNLDVPWIAAIPFKGQELRWHKETQDEYNFLLSKASEIVIVCEGGYHPFKMQKRNEWMVDRSNAMLALWDGSTGGTYNCIEYAKKVQRPVYNVWPGWETFEDE